MDDLTLEDIAKKAGVSRSTVSRVINDQPNVRDQVRKRVLDVIQDTGYHPNAAARTLASQRSRMIGLVLQKDVGTFFSDPFFPQLVKGIAEACNFNDLTMGLFILNTKQDEEKIFPQISRKGLLDGVLVQAGHTGDELIARLIETDMPMVTLGRPYGNKKVNYIDVDNYHASKAAVQHLINGGRKRIGTISGPVLSAASLDRKQGYLDALADNNFKIEEGLIITGDYSEERGYQAMLEMLPARPDAVYAASDLIAYGAMRAILEAQLTIPEDIAVVGFDDLPGNHYQFMNMPLTTVHQPVQQYGIKAVELLIDVIENGIKPERNIMIDAGLIIRQTSVCS